jgi:hypothetical protein
MIGTSYNYIIDKNLCRGIMLRIEQKIDEESKQVTLVVSFVLPNKELVEKFDAGFEQEIDFSPNMERNNGTFTIKITPI